MSRLTNLEDKVDPWVDAAKGDDRSGLVQDGFVHVRIQQRKGRKTLTTIQGLKVELVSKELNNLAAILHVYAGGLIFIK